MSTSPTRPILHYHDGKASPRIETLWLNLKAAQACPRLGLLAACGEG